MNTVLCIAIIAIGLVIAAFGAINLSPKESASINHFYGVMFARADLRSDKTQPLPPRVLTVARMPCGNEATVTEGQRWPDKDVPCPCGDPKHLLWKIGGADVQPPESMESIDRRIRQTETWLKRLEQWKSREAVWRERANKELAAGSLSPEIQDALLKECDEIKAEREVILAEGLAIK